MKTPVIQNEPDGPERQAQAAQDPTSPPARPARRMTGGRIVLLIVGILVGLVGLASVIGGIVVLAVNHTERDSAGFFSSRAEPLVTETHALVSDRLDVGTDGPDWLFEEGRLATIRLRGSSQDSAREIFIGVGPTREVVRYLSGTSYARVADINVDPFRVRYEPSSGEGPPAEPASQDFWSESASGPGAQTLQWEVAEGDWSFVVLNADASRGVDVRMSFGAKVGFVFWFGVGLVIAGAIILAVAATFIYFAVRRPARVMPAAATS
jgi:hypothetical protein